MKMDYAELRRIYRLEQNSSQLVSLEEDFLDSIREYFTTEHKAYTQALAAGHLSRVHDFTNAQKLVGEIFLLREKKLLTKALTAENTPLNTTGLFREEKPILEKLVALLREHSELAQQNFAKGTPSTVPSNLESQAKEFKTVYVKIMGSVPGFVGSDLKEYGPFSLGQTAELPEKTAQLLVQRNLAEELA